MNDQVSASSLFLSHCAAADEPVLLAKLALDAAAVREVQLALARHGLLDPPADGAFGAVTQWAVCEAARAAGLPFSADLSPALARRLLNPAPLFPLRAGEGFAGHLFASLERRGDWICHHPGARTIVYVERTGPDGERRDDESDGFSDLRAVLGWTGGRPVLLGAWPATTASGPDGLDDPVDALGPPRLEPGQHRAWVMGRTAIGTELEQDALVQCAPVRVRRDAGEDGKRAGDPRQTGHFLIDQHGAFDAARVGDKGVGCLVAQSQAGHQAFLALLREDPRYRANHAHVFSISLLTRDDLD